MLSIDTSSILKYWKLASRFPKGPFLFSRFLGFVVPYSGSIGARIVMLKPGKAVIELKDRKKVRNHLNSIHAMALANLCELTSGLAFLTALPPGYRAILKTFSIEFIKKGCGVICASCEIPSWIQDQLKAGHVGRKEWELEVQAYDKAGQMIAQARPKWITNSS